MIKLIDIGKQLGDDTFRYSFYNTVTNSYVKFYGVVVFGSVADLVEVMDMAKMGKGSRERFLEKAEKWEQTLKGG